MPTSTLKMKQMQTHSHRWRQQSIQMKRHHWKLAQGYRWIVLSWNWQRRRRKHRAPIPKIMTPKKWPTTKNRKAAHTNCFAIQKRKVSGNRPCGLQFGRYTFYLHWPYPTVSKIVSRNCFRSHFSCASYGLARYRIWSHGWSQSSVWFPWSLDARMKSN